jgi:hypothetical protein
LPFLCRFALIPQSGRVPLRDAFSRPGG